MNVRSALIVDDSRSARFALRKFLESHGIRVEAVESGRAAYAHLESDTPDVIFLDQTMPDETGLDVLDKLRARKTTAGIPVVICCAHEGDEFAEQARAHGAAAILQKPPTAEELQIVLGLLDHQQRGAAPTAAKPARAAGLASRVLIDEDEPDGETRARDEAAEARRVATLLQDEMQSLSHSMDAAARPEPPAADAALAPKLAALESRALALERRLEEAEAHYQRLEGELRSLQMTHDEQLRALHQRFTRDLHASMKTVRDQTVSAMRDRLLEAFAARDAKD